MKQEDLVSEAARAMGLKRAAKAGHDELSRLGKLGAKRLWDKIGTGKERTLELRRRSLVRKRNRRARIEKLLQQK